jgi:hypothetical protein
METKTYMNLRILFIYLFLICCINSLAQPELTFYNDVGKNNASQGLYIKSATLGNYTFGKYMVGTGFQFDLKSSNKNVFSGYRINASRDFVIKGIPIELQGFWIWTTFAEILGETDWGASLNMRHNHFETTIGTNFRTYTYRKKAIEEYGIAKNASKIHETFNMMYSFTYYLKPTDDQWNVGLSMTNIDYFIINQETNPVFDLRGSYKPRPPLCLYVQAWYKTAGAFNLEVNYFGFFIRTGIIWDINLTD